MGEGTHFLIPWVQKPIIFDCRSRPRNIPVITGSKGECLGPPTVTEPDALMGFFCFFSMWRSHVPRVQFGTESGKVWSQFFVPEQLKGPFGAVSHPLKRNGPAFTLERVTPCVTNKLELKPSLNSLRGGFRSRAAAGSKNLSSLLARRSLNVCYFSFSYPGEEGFGVSRGLPLNS